MVCAMAMENHAKSLKEILITPEEQVIIIFFFSKLLIQTVFGDRNYIELDLEITFLIVEDFCNGY